ncbi:ABC transporter ATP-binding protein [Jiella endophytica]|uniref:ABC transporter ATP-binding protein n=1 Tax=Jiella endophytica TaxID=2558362 RepID=A0A4Y8R9H6_9HYPH|nr:ABC transporter ATP-binding protein [Jiella endophytica]TFF17683.1 ABC transporter ATP-binding protein [Jiella endophytica]
MTSALSIDGLSVARGGRTVLFDLSMRLESGRIVALLGPNGAGKSSLVLALAGLLPIASGTIHLDGGAIGGLPPDRIRRAGIAAVPEGHRVLTRLSVRDNIRVAAPKADGGFERATAIFPELSALAERPADTLSGGQQQMLALAQALVCRPKFLLADEMSLGLAPVIVRRLMGVVETAARGGVGVLLIEQFTHLALEIADHAYVINRGRIRFSGEPAELKANPRLLEEAYLSLSA